MDDSYGLGWTNFEIKSAVWPYEFSRLSKWHKIDFTPSWICVNRTNWRRIQLRIPWVAYNSRHIWDEWRRPQYWSNYNLASAWFSTVLCSYRV